MSSSKPKGAQTQTEEGNAAAARPSRSGSHKKKPAAGGGKPGGGNITDQSWRNQSEALRAMGRCTPQERNQIMRYFSEDNTQMGQLLQRVDFLWERYGPNAAQQQTQQGQLGRQVTAG
jgi:hypothetical protein